MHTEVKLFYDIDPNSPNEERNFFIGQIKHAPLPEGTPPPLPHRHPFYEIIFVEKGNGIMRIDFIDRPMQKGSLYLMLPSQIHLPLYTGEFQGFLLRFDISIFADKTFLENLSIFNFDYLLVEEPAYSALEGLLLSLHEEFKSAKALKQCTINNLLKLFLIQVQRLLPNVVNENTQTTIFGALNTLLESNNYKIQTPAFYAKKLKISLKVLNHAVKEYTSITCGEYIRSKTVIEAKRLLCYTGMNSNEIAALLGFEDAAYFSRFFKRETGLTPLVFRKQSL
ncbi:MULTISPECIES: helix-turn-helix domain-containing protein [unclassified Sulfurospirillum]|uniref:helix-turn-helix domain-containing protein n=1 Tax=unclassified Sulfurospirillum TaxID=2618290 RepID=UPI00068C43EB|nr:MULTISPECIES: helix-turn-helix domain-containing protein [unclassified Sulfurospirillum]